MKRTFAEAMAHRRSYYSIGSESPVSDEKIEEVVKFAVKNVASAFNSQSTRAVLLLGENHHKLWSIVKETLRKIVPEKSFKATEDKIDGMICIYDEDFPIINSKVKNKSEKPILKRFFNYVNRLGSLKHVLVLE